MRKLIYCVLLGMVFSISACGSTQTTTDSIEMISHEESETKKDIDFEEANILSFEMTDRDDDSYEEIISSFTVTNNGADPVDNFSADYVYKDSAGNIICTDGRYHDCQMMPGTSAIMRSYSDLDDHKKDEITTIEVTKYEYSVGTNNYTIDLENESITVSDNMLNNDAAFDETNIIYFEYEDKGINFDSYEVGVRAINNGTINVTYVSFDMAFYDADGNYLYGDGRYNDNTLNASNYVEMKSFCDEGLSSQVNSYEVYAYEYKLAKDDDYGFNTYKINLQTKEVEGMHED